MRPVTRSHRAVCGPAILVALVMIACVLAEAPGEVWARAGGSGSRGSRSYSSPVRPAPRSPDRSAVRPAAPAPAPVSPSSPPSLFRGLMGGVAGLLIGGFIGSLLFGGFRGGFGGVGLLDLLLVGGAALLLLSFFRRRLAEAPALATPAGYGGHGGGGAGIVAEMPPEAADRERGISHIRQMDASFDPAQFVATAAAMFTRVEGAFGQGDMGALRDVLTPELQAEMQARCDRLRAEGRTNRVEQIEVDRAEVTEAWQETGQDFVTVYLSASMLDYVVDARGGLVEGSNSAPVSVEEYWTFTRPVGAGRWKLTAIQQPSS